MPEQERLTNSDLQPPAAALRQMIMGFRTTQLIYVAAKLGIADLLKDGARSSHDLATSAGADARALHRLLRALASLGIFSETADGCFELTPLAQPLRSGIPGSLRGMAILYGEEWCWRAYGALLHSVRTGQTAFDHVHGMRIFEFLSNNAGPAVVFNQAMSAFTEQESVAILGAYDFSTAATVIDVGGGHGTLMAALLKAYPEMRGILFDLPMVVEGARSVLAQEGVASRCTVAAGDFFRSAPPRADLYILKSIVHDWDDERSIAMLKNCRASIADDGKLLLIERVVPPGNVPSEAKLFDINMLVNTGGFERTEAEYRALLKAAGFTLTTIIPTQSPLSLIEAAAVPGHGSSYV